MRWLREQFDASTRKAMELAQNEMARKRPGGEEEFADKWKMRIRIRSWSHSIRPNQLNSWNKGINKIKLIHTTDRNELIVEFTIGKNVLMQDLWGFGMQNVVIFMAALHVFDERIFLVVSAGLHVEVLRINYRPRKRSSGACRSGSPSFASHGDTWRSKKKTLSVTCPWSTVSSPKHPSLNNSSTIVISACSA